MVPPIVGRSHDDFGRRWAGWDSFGFGAGGDLKLTLALSPARRFPYLRIQQSQYLIPITLTWPIRTFPMGKAWWTTLRPRDFESSFSCYCQEGFFSLCVNGGALSVTPRAKTPPLDWATWETTSRL
jgi:hypothetical protein